MAQSAGVKRCGVAVYVGAWRVVKYPGIRIGRARAALFGALLQLVSQAMFASLVLAHNGAPSFLSEFLCVLLNSNHFNTIHQQGQTMVKIHYKLYFTMAVNLE